MSVIRFEPWTRCPSCDSERYHLLGERSREDTDRVVKRVELVVFPKVAFRAAVEELSVVTPSWVIRDVAETAEWIARECLDCQYTWQEPTGERGARS